MKKIISCAAALAVVLSFSANALPQGEGVIPDIQTVFAASPTINATEATIYGMSSDYDGTLTIPGNTTFQIKVSGAKSVKYSVKSGSTASVDSNGLVSVSYTTWYWYGYTATTAKPDDMTGITVERSMYEGDTVINVNADGTVFTVTVHVKDYSNEYADKVIDDYIKKNITSGMTDYEKVCAAAKMAADYNYDYRYQSYQDMIIHGGGDCWASTNLIIAVSKKLGFDAWIRNGNRDAGAGSGHRNALVEGKDGKLYEAEAGYGVAAPRPYNVKERTSLFSTRTNYTYGGLEVYQYDGKEIPETLEVPAEIDGKPVVSIGSKFLYSEHDIKKVVLPESIKNIGNYAFFDMKKLEEINIPASLEQAGYEIFTHDGELKTVNVGKGCIYTYENGSFYSEKAKTANGCYLAQSYSIPDSITTIMNYAYFYNTKVKTAVISKNVTDIQEGGFANCSSLRYVKINGAAKLGQYAFAGNSKLARIVIPKDVTEIGEYVFHSDENLTIYTEKGSAADTYASQNSIKVKYFDELKAGDVNNDGSVNMKDLTLLQQYLAQWDVDADEYTGDVNKDDSITMSDLTRMQQYLAGWDVTLE